MAVPLLLVSTAVRKEIGMNLSEYLKLRGGNNITISEANAIGLIIVPGWPSKYAEQEVPDHLAQAVRISRGMPWPRRRKYLRKMAGNCGAREEDYTLDATYKRIRFARNLLHDALVTAEHDPLPAFVKVEEALAILDEI